MFLLKSKSEEHIDVEGTSLKEHGQLEEKSPDKLLALSRERARNQVLNQLKKVKTCALALELCLLIRTHRAILERKEVHDYCTFISKLCTEAGCAETGELCEKAAKAVLQSEETYLELCERSCKKCVELRLPKRQLPNKTTYVT
jgi:hypothetical protein